MIGVAQRYLSRLYLRTRGSLYNTSSVAKLSVGDAFELKKAFSSKDLHLFSVLSEDRNPIHLDEKFAKASRFGRCIVHGTLVESLFSGLLASLGNGTILLEKRSHYKSPVFTDEELTAKAVLTAVRGRIGEFELKCTVADKVVIDGFAKVLLPKQSQQT